MFVSSDAVFDIHYVDASGQEMPSEKAFVPKTDYNNSIAEERSMAMLITALVQGQTQEGYDAAMLTLRPLLEQAKGFIAHGAGMSPEGWRVFEIWETQQQAIEFFAKHIRLNLPAGVTPKRTYVELHNLMVRPKAESTHSREPAGRSDNPEVPQ
jgi:hypothetical protein